MFDKAIDSATAGDGRRRRAAHRARRAAVLCPSDVITHGTRRRRNVYLAVARHLLLTVTGAGVDILLTRGAGRSGAGR